MNRKILWIILVVAFVLRFYKLGIVPPSLDWDENSNAYNAYSILKTGKDEYGNFLPLTNRSFDDYKPPMYMYLEIPSVAIFGLTPFAARLPSAIFGFLTIPLIFILARKIFDRSNLKFEIAAASSLLLAISPWHLQFSRVGFEATVGLFMAVAAAITLLNGRRDKNWLLVSGFLFGASMYSYHSVRIFLPLLYFSAFIIWRDEFLKLPKKYLALFVLIAFLVILPLLISAPKQAILSRFESSANQQRLENVQKSITLIEQDQNRYLKLLHNRRIIIAVSYLGNYLSNFDPNFIFLKGDNNYRHHIESFGLLYLLELPIVIIGLYQLIKDKNKEAFFILSWIVIAPIAAAPVTPNPHAIRSLPLIIGLEIAAAFGVVSILYNKFFIKKPTLFILGIWLSLSFFIYLHNYYIHYPVNKAPFWQYGYSQAALETQKLKDQYEKINIDKSIEQAYIFWLFNLKYDPQIFQIQGSKSHFDKYYFDANIPTESNELYISASKIFPGSFKVVKTIYYPDGTENIKIDHP